MEKKKSNGKLDRSKRLLMKQGGVGEDQSGDEFCLVRFAEGKRKWRRINEPLDRKTLALRPV